MLKIGDKVYTEEHPKSIGFIVEARNEKGYVVEFVTPKSETLPYGHIVREFWSLSDASQLKEIE